MPVKVKSPPARRAAASIYKWRGGGRAGFNGVPAQAVGEELDRLEVRPGEFHKTVDVLDAARHPDSALHGVFEWDDDKAGELYRLTQCRAMLRSIACVIVQQETRTKRPVYVHITDAEGPKYVKASRVASDAEVKKLAIDEALSMLNGLRRRFDFISELAPVFEAIENVTEKIRRKKPKIRRKKPR